MTREQYLNKLNKLMDTVVKVSEKVTEPKTDTNFPIEVLFY